ncbi:MAG: hypothetical protein ACRD3G_06375 [Vicinamibacterales bacterium]
MLIFRGLGSVYTFQRRRFEDAGSDRNVKDMAILIGMIANLLTDQITSLALGLVVEQIHDERPVPVLNRDGKTPGLARN